MAAPTTVRVEASSITTTVLRWSYSGSNAIAVYRSTDGSVYAEITDAVSRVDPGTTEYVDTGLTLGTKYWYKLSDDIGSTFSDVVTVWTHSCAGPISDTHGLDLPPFLQQEDVSPERLNEMERRIEAALNGQKLSPEQCVACPEDGAVSIDCSDGCVNWTVIADEDINSISINWCDQFDGNIDFVIPPGADVGICGFPAGFGFGGDECTKARVKGGSKGRSMAVWFVHGGRAYPFGGGSSPGVKPRAGDRSTQSAGARGGSGCTCVPGHDRALKIKACNAGNSLNCSSTKKLTLNACGGRGPYTWSKTGGITLQVGDNGTPGTTATGSSVVVKPPTNTGSGLGGTAYQISGYHCNICFTGVGNCGATGVNKKILYGCNDQVLVCGNSATSDACVPALPSAASMRCHNGTCISPDPQCTVPTCPDAGLGDLVTSSCDARTAMMISNGCEPCGLQNGSTVTVTDSLGTQVTIVVKV